MWVLCISGCVCVGTIQMSPCGICMMPANISMCVFCISGCVCVCVCFVLVGHQRHWQAVTASYFKKFCCCHWNILSIVRRRGELWPPRFSPQNKAGRCDASLIRKEMPVSPLDIPYHTKQSRAFQHCVSWENVSILIIVRPQRQTQSDWLKGNMSIFGPWTIWPISDMNRLIIYLKQRATFEDLPVYQSDMMQRCMTSWNVFRSGVAKLFHLWVT